MVVPNNNKGQNKMPKLKPYSSELDLVSHEAIYGRIKSQGVQLNLDAHFAQEVLVRPDGINLEEITLSALIVKWMETLNEAKTAERKQQAWLDTSECAPCPQESAEIAEMFADASALFFELSEFLACPIRLDRGVMLHEQADPTDFIAKKHEKGAPCFVVDGILMTAMVAPDGNTVFGFCDLHDCQLRGGIVFITPEGEIDDAVNDSLAGNHTIRGHWEFRL